MALMKYAEVLTLAKDKIKEAMAPLRAREMKKKAELEVAKLEGTIAEKQQKIQELTAEYPIDFDKVLDARDDLHLTERKQKQLLAIIEELF